MGREPLKNKPLVEAILEVRWALQSARAKGQLPMGVVPSTVGPDGVPVVHLDPHFRLVLGRFYDRIQGEYPTHESLPNAYLPDLVVGQQVQHRFRHKDGWPIIQLGPGILTVNDTDKYKWEDFLPRCIQAITTLFDAHPEPGKLKIESLVLRYIDAAQGDIGAFLKEKMAVQCALPDALFKESPVQPTPGTFRWDTSYTCSSPPGKIALVFSTGGRENKAAMIWETVLKSHGAEIPKMPDDFETWLDAAHKVTDDWFFKLIEGGSGELKKRFKNGD